MFVWEARFWKETRNENGLFLAFCYLPLCVTDRERWDMLAANALIISVWYIMPRFDLEILTITFSSS
jgi:hypothetical protein